MAATIPSTSISRSPSTLSAAGPRKGGGAVAEAAADEDDGLLPDEEDEMPPPLVWPPSPPIGAPKAFSSSGGGAPPLRREESAAHALGLVAALNARRAVGAHEEELDLVGADGPYELGGRALGEVCDGVARKNRHLGAKLALSSPERLTRTLPTNAPPDAAIVRGRAEGAARAVSRMRQRRREGEPYSSTASVSTTASLTNGALLHRF